MDISEVAKRTKLKPSKIRYYEEKGLIYSTGRAGLKRVFPENIIEQLSLIALGQNAGFSLEEIKSMLLRDGLNIDRDALLQKANSLDKRISEMTAMRDGLRHAAACKAPSHMECPTFRRILNLAGKRMKKTNRF